MKTAHRHAASDVAMHVAFAMWALSSENTPKAVEIQAHFDIDYKTARKWRNALMQVRDPHHPIHRLAATGSATPSPEESKS